MKEGFTPHVRVSAEHIPKVRSEEELAESDLESLLSDPQHKFLSAIPQNAEFIENAPTAVEALAFARRKIAERHIKTFHFETVVSVEGVEPVEATFEGMKDTVFRVIKGAQEIGRGRDGFVVLDKNEVRNIPPEVCYKFTAPDRARRGQNTTSEEAEIQGRFYDIAKNSKFDIGVPIPFYSLEIADKQMIAMEKLNALSLEDILHRKKGTLPDWIEVDSFCDQLRLMVEEFHRHNLFHRDLHFGNIMVSQSESRGVGEKAGYVIDFGVSGYAVEDMDPYKKEVAGKLFTYDNDYGIIESVRKEMYAFRRHRYDAIN